MKTKQKAARSLTAALLISGSLVGGANASITVTWSETGSSVKASYVGSINTSTWGTPTLSFINGSTIVLGPISAGGENRGSWSFAGGDGTASSRTDNYDNVGVTIYLPPVGRYDSDLQTGSPFAFRKSETSGDGGEFWLPENYMSNSLISGEVIWDNSSLNDFFPNNELGSGDLIAWQSNDSSQQVTFTAIPEPSSVVLIGVGCLSLTLRRSRQ